MLPIQSALLSVFGDFAVTLGIDSSLTPNRVSDKPVEVGTEVGERQLLFLYEFLTTGNEVVPATLEFLEGEVRLLESIPQMLEIFAAPTGCLPEFLFKGLIGIPKALRVKRGILAMFLLRFQPG